MVKLVYSNKMHLSAYLSMSLLIAHLLLCFNCSVSIANSSASETVVDKTRTESATSNQNHQTNNKTAKQDSFWLMNNSIAQQLAADDDLPIVMNSVHSRTTSSLPKLRTQTNLQASAAQQQQHIPYNRPPSQPHTAAHPTFSSQRPRPSLIDDKQEGRSGAPAMSGQQQQQQPSQEFESPASGHFVSRGPSRWTTQTRPIPDSPSNSGSHYGINSAPYALQQPLHQHWNAESFSSSSGTSHLMTGNNNQHNKQSSLIRDTSQLQSNSEQQQDDSQPLQRLQQQQQHYQQVGSEWMQSVRDNHHGVIRSRFNLSWLASANLPSGMARNEPAIASMGADGATLPETHMKAKADSISSAAFYEGNDQQMARSASSNTTPEPSNWARRNSKFTRQTSEMTTPLNLVSSSTTGVPSSSSTELAVEEGDNENFETDSASLDGQKSENSSTVEVNSSNSTRTVQLVSNNHAPADKRKVAARPKVTARKLINGYNINELKEVQATARALKEPKQPYRTWTRHLPTLLQRTLSSVLRKFTGTTLQGSQNKQQQPIASASQHLTPQIMFPAGGNLLVGSPQEAGGSSSAMSFLASALSASAVAALKPENSLSDLSIGSPEQTSLIGKQLLGAAANTLHENRQLLRQHANKKIIDSMIDLPVSERRQTRVERNAINSVKVANSTYSATTTTSKVTSTPTKRRGKSQQVGHWVTLEELDSDSIGSDDQSEDDDQDVAESREEPAVAARSVDSRAPAELEDQDEDDTQGTEIPNENEQPPTGEEGGEPQFFFYSPVSHSLRALDGPLRMLGSVERHHSDSSLSSPEEPSEVRRLPPLRRRRPESATPSKRRKPGNGGNRPALLSVAPLGLHSLRLRPLYSPSTSTAAPQAATPSPKVPSPPNSQVNPSTGPTTGQPQLSPMSSSINVLDLDPSMTQLAHNKLIVAKYKPSKLKLPARATTPINQQQAKQTNQRRQPSTSTTLRPSGIMLASELMGKSGGLNHLPVQQSTTSKVPIAKPSESAKTIHVEEKEKTTRPVFHLGNTVITNNHVSDIISRWTRLGGIRPTKPIEQSSKVHHQADSSELAGRVSLTARPTSGPFSRVPQIVESGVRIPEQWNITAGSAKSNYSLLSINNRERINPLLLPVYSEHQQLKTTTNTTLSRKPSPGTQRVRLTSTTARPSVQKVTSTTAKSNLATGRPNLTSTTILSQNLFNISSSSSRKPVVESDSYLMSLPNSLDELTGQIVRSQHKQTIGPTRKPTSWYLQHPTKPIRVYTSGSTISESERLRNQLASLTGSLDARAQQPAAPENEANISGHVTLVASLQEEGIEDAARDANKYETIESSTELPVTEGVPGEHQAIVIIKDNHHPNLRTRPGKPPTAPPAVGNPAHSDIINMSNKYLDELVNGTRIRPSSVERMKLSSSFSSPNDWLTQQQYPRSSHSPSPASSLQQIKLISTNHAPPANSTDWQRRSGLLSAVKQPDQQHQFSSSSSSNVHGAPLPESAGISSKLDYRAQELLQDVFDRDPSYSASFFAASPEHQAERLAGNTLTKPETSPKAENSRRIPSNEEYLHFQTNHKQSNTPAYELTATHYTLNPDSSSQDYHINYSTIPDGSTTPYEYEPLVGRPIDGSTSSAYSLGSDYTGRSNLPTTTEMPSSAALDPSEQTENSVEINKRASMRRNQAMIQSILMAIEAKKNAQQVALNLTLQQQQDNEQQQQPAATSHQDNQLDGYPTTQVDLGSNSELTTSESTVLYSPTQIADTPSASTSSRYPTLSVESVGTSRQKINKPSTPAMSDYRPAGTNLPSSPSPTNKLTESPSNDSNLRQTIKNRIHIVDLPSTSTMAPHHHLGTGSSSVELDESTTSGNGHDQLVSRPNLPATPAPSEGTSSSAEIGESSQTSEEHQGVEVNLSDQLELAAQQQMQEELAVTGGHSQSGSSYELPPLNELEVAPTKKRPLRPMIIRRRPRPPGQRRPPTGQPQQQQQPQYLVVSQSLGVNSGGHSTIRRRKPGKRPGMLISKRPKPQLSLSELLDQENSQSSSGELHNETYAIQVDADNLDGNDQLEFAELPQSQVPKRRHRPTILLQHKPYSTSNTPTIIRKRPSYAIRYPPGSIRIPAQVPADYQQQQESGKNNSSPGRIRPQASIILPMQSLMKLRPAQDIRTRPLTIIDPVSSGDTSEALPGGPPLGLTIVPETTILHNNMVVSYKPGRPLPPENRPHSSQTHDNSSATTPMPTIAQALELANNGSSRIPVSSGSDTHLVSIHLHGQRPFGNNSTPSFEPSSSTAAPTLSTSSYPPHSSSHPHRPINIVINGLSTGVHGFGANSSSEQHKPGKPMGGNSVLEAGSMSVLSQAANGNHSRPWYPTVGTGSMSSDSRHNATNNSTVSGPLSDLSDLSSSGSSSSGSISSHDSSSESSGSYQNHHHHQNQHQNQHIGMPFLGSGGSLSSVLRPSQQQQQQQRPYRWRVKKRPNGNSSGASTAESSSSYVYRPATPGLSPIQQFFTMNGLVAFYDNLKIYLARIRTFLISLMVMFLPPLALAASVANVMSNS